MSSPVIGITTCAGQYDSGPLEGVSRQWVSIQYGEAVARAGGIPVLIPMLAESSMNQAMLNELVPKLDGLVITGGGEISRGMVQSEERGSRAEDLAPTPTLRTECDEAILNMFLKARKPVLGICYGMQLINAAMGGRITDDFHKWLGSDKVKHTPTRGGAPCGQHSHDVTIEPNTELHRLFAKPADDTSTPITQPVTSLHVQGIAKEHVAEGLVVSAVAPDGCVEGIEIVSTSSWILGVQWHPEQHPNDEMGPLLRRLIERAAAQMLGRLL